MSGYSPTVWVDGAAPALSAANLNKMELGLSNALGYDSQADLVASGRPTAVQTAWTRGARACDDGGGGCWIWDGAATLTDAVHLLPSGHVGAGRWVPLVDGPVDLRLAGVTSTVADAPDNWAGLVALCRFLSTEKGGGEIAVADIGAPFAVDGGVPPQYMDHLHVRGPGEIRNVNPGSDHNRIKGPIFYGGTYGPSTAVALAYNETGYDLEDAAAGATAVELSTVGDAAQFTVGDLVLIHDGTVFYRQDLATHPRYLYPHVREVVGIEGAVLSISPALTHEVGNDAIVRRLNTGAVTVNNSPWPGITTAYLARDFEIACNLSVAFDYNEITGEQIPVDLYGNVTTGCFYNIGFRAKYQGRFESKNGFSGNLGSCCQIDADVVCGDGRAYDAGYATESSNIVIRLSHRQPETTAKMSNMILLNEGSHSCRLNISTPQPISSLVEGTNVLLSTGAYDWDCHLDLRLPLRKSRRSGVAVAGALLVFGFDPEEDEDDAESSYYNSQNMLVTGRIQVLEAYSLVKFASPGEVAPNLPRNTLLRDLHLDCPTLSDPDGKAMRWQECSAVALQGVRSQAVGTLAVTSCSDCTLLDCDLPGVTLSVVTPLEGFWARVHGNTFANLLTSDDLLVDGQINTVADGASQVIGGLQVLGRVYADRGTIVLDAAETVQIKTAAELGDVRTYLVKASSAQLQIVGLAIVRVAADQVYVSSVHATGMTWGTNSGAGLTITNSTDTERGVTWSLVEF